jgi:hypothetical protein
VKSLNEFQHAQTFALLSIFVLIHHYGLSDFKSMGFASKLGTHRKTGSVGKVVLGRWFLLWFGETFGIQETKSALKYLAGRKKKDGYDKRELTHYKPGEFTRKLRKKNDKQRDFGF